jgi:zinc/manganese transport system ATP-binding protein
MNVVNTPVATGATVALELTGAAFSYGNDVALDEVNLAVFEGEALALIGPNGSGKSTFLKGVLGLLPVTAGTLQVFGADRTSETARSLGYLPQREDVDPEFPVSLEQVVMMGRYRRMGWWRLPARADRAAVVEALRMTGLTSLAKNRFGLLSGGQQQRGLLARALAANPHMLLLDEPFNGLDQPNRDALVETIRSLKAHGVTILLTTHDLVLAREVCDKILLVNGKQIAFGSLSEVLTLENLQAAFSGVQVEVDEHTVVLPGHDGH